MTKHSILKAKLQKITITKKFLSRFKGFQKMIRKDLADQEDKNYHI